MDAQKMKKNTRKIVAKETTIDSTRIQIKSNDQTNSKASSNENGSPTKCVDNRFPIFV